MQGLDLGGTVAVVTGAGRGIGRATALAFARAGADVVVNYRRDQAAAAEVVAACRRQGVQALAVGADVSREDEAARLFETAASLGPPGVVVASAGIWEGAPLAEVSRADWDRTIEQNLTSLFLTCREAVRRMRGRGGSIVVVSSTAAQRGEAGYSAYAATKGAAVSFVKSLATELGSEGIRVNAVAPGWVLTDMTRTAIEADRAAIVAAIPLRRVAEPEDVALPILFLASPLARHVTGEVLNVNGGSVLVG